MSALDLSPTARTRAELLGDTGTRWLDDLESIVAELTERWSITLGPAFPGANEGYVAPATTADGQDAVLKVAMPMPWRTWHGAAIERAEGRGYVRLLAADPSRDAMLMEALGPALDDHGWPVERMLATLCATLKEAWALPIASAPYDGRQKAHALAELIERLWRELDRPCPVAVVDHARRLADRRAAAHREDRCVHVHGDPHAANAMRVPSDRPGAASGFVFIDPDGFAAEPAYDLGVVLRDWDAELSGGDAPSLARRYCALLAEHSGEHPDAIWEWGFVERVATGLYVLEHGLEWGRRKLGVAARLL